MQTERYRSVLSCYRPGRDDPAQPTFAEALAALKTDADLAAWHAEESSFDTEFRDSLSRCAVPPMDEVVRTGQPAALRWPRLLAAAAAVAIVAGGLAILSLGRLGGDAGHRVGDFREAMASFAATGQIRLDRMGGDFASLQEFMASQGGATGDELPKVFASAMPKGCQLIRWEGSSVSLYCFAIDRGKIVHAFLLPKSEVSERTLAQLSQVQVHSTLQTGGWVAGETVYLLVSSAPDIDISPFLAERVAFLPRRRSGLLSFRSTALQSRVAGNPTGSCASRPDVAPSG
jgi:hypothetical protein